MYIYIIFFFLCVSFIVSFTVDGRRQCPGTLFVVEQPCMDGLFWAVKAQCKSCRHTTAQALHYTFALYQSKLPALHLLLLLNLLLLSLLCVCLLYLPPSLALILSRPLQIALINLSQTLNPAPPWVLHLRLPLPLPLRLRPRPLCLPLYLRVALYLLQHLLLPLLKRKQVSARHSTKGEGAAK